PARGIHAGGNRRGTWPAAGKPRAATGGLGTAFAQLAATDRHAHRRARTIEGRTDGVHRLRLPVHATLPARKPERPRCRVRSRTTCVDATPATVAEMNTKKTCLPFATASRLQVM